MRASAAAYLLMASRSIACITGTSQLFWFSQYNCTLSAIASTFCRSMVKSLRLAL
jgi:hypothetical protein